MTLRSYIRVRVRVRVKVRVRVRIRVRVMVRVSLTLTLTKQCSKTIWNYFCSMTKWGDFLKNGGIFCNFSCSISVYL